MACFQRLTQIHACGVAIGDMILDLQAAEEADMINWIGPVFDVPFWNEVMELGQRRGKNCANRSRDP